MQWILRFRVYVIICLAVVLISAAVIFSVLRAVLPYATGYKNEIQQEISQQIGLPVKIDSIDAAIHWFSPRLRLIDVVVYDEKGTIPIFDFKEAFVELDVIASIFRQEFIVDDVGLIGVDLSIEKLSDNEWKVQGIKFTSEGSSELPEQFLYMLKNSDYLLHDSNIHFQDHTDKKLNISFLDVNIDVENNFNNHDIKLSMNLPEAYGRDLAVVANLRGDIDSLVGDVYVEAHQLNAKQWNKKFNLSDEYQLNAILDVDLWVTLDGSNISTLYTHLVSEDLSIRNNATKESWGTRFMSTDIRYVYDGSHWDIAVSDFYFGERLNPDWQRPVNISVRDDDENYYLNADFLRFADVQKISDVFLNKEMLADSERFKAYEIQSDIYNLNLRLPKDMSSQVLMDELYLEATVSDFSMQDHENNVRLSGLDASLHYGNHQAVFDLISENTELELADLFRDPIFTQVIRGKLALSYDDDHWQLKSDQLQVKNAHINTFSRLDIQFSSLEDIFTDIQTDFYNADASYTKHYLPVGIMSPGLVDWLDMAVTDGDIADGKFILHGALNAFPYEENDGVFQVLFSPENVDMRFLKGWPLLKNTSATIKFNNKSLVVKDAKSQTQNAKLFNGEVVIADLTDPHLTVTINAKSRVEDVQSYIWNSPLDEVLGGAMRMFQFEGKSDLKLEIELPLNDDETEMTIDGHLNFINSQIYYPALGYEVNNVNGIIDFTKDSIFANSIKAKVQGENILINASTQNGVSGREIIFDIDGVMSADYLLQHYEWIPEKWASGKSRWNVDIEVPYQPEDYLVHIKANTDFENVAFQVSDKVYKPFSEKVNFSTEIDVLDENGLRVNAIASFDHEGEGSKDELAAETDSRPDSRPEAEIDSEVEQENIFSVYAQRDEDKVWILDIKSDYITGKGGFTEGLAKDTQVKLDLKNIDLHALFVTTSDTETNVLKPADIPPLDLKSEKVLWNNLVFTDVKLVTSWHKHGMLINQYSLKAPSMVFDARGTWLTSWNNSHETVLEGTINGNNLGKTLTGLGFEKSIDRSKYKAKFNAKWSAEPYSLSWANVKGESSFEMYKGQILEVDPGAGGRLLGLLNIFKLANRLAFDFTDVTREGFSFDSIKGNFEFVNGDGALKKFDISAAAADINMFGSIGLIDRDYGLLMRVKPHTDTLTFAGGALLGGVAVGAGLALIQKVFDLGVIGHNVYSITGSWDDPEVEKIIERTLDSDEEDDF